MADQRLITLYPGATPSTDIVLRPLPVADVSTTTIYLRAGDATPANIVLRDQAQDAGGAVSVALTGISATGAIGTVSVVAGADVTVGATGVSSAGAVGSVVGSSAAVSTGNAAAGNVGAVLAQRSVSATGASATGAPGAVTAQGTNTLAGVIASGVVGTLTVSVVAAALTGSAATGALGALFGTNQVALAGDAATGLIGSATAQVSLSASGIGASAEAGALVGQASIDLSGNATTGAVGTVVAESAPVVVVALTGVARAVTAGDVAAANVVGLSGVAVSARSGTVVVPSASDPRLDQILAILMGYKVYDSATRLWRVYDHNGVELADPSGVLLRGLHGWLLWQANQLPIAPANDAQSGVSRLFYYQMQEAALLARDTAVEKETAAKEAFAVIRKAARKAKKPAGTKQQAEIAGYPTVLEEQAALPAYDELDWEILIQEHEALKQAVQVLSDAKAKVKRRREEEAILLLMSA